MHPVKVLPIGLSGNGIAVGDGQASPNVSRDGRNDYSGNNNANIPAKAGIQNSTGCRIKSGMTNVNMFIFRSNNRHPASPEPGGHGLSNDIGLHTGGIICNGE
jgi:hypothetical protein